MVGYEIGTLPLWPRTEGELGQQMKGVRDQTVQPTCSGSEDNCGMLGDLRLSPLKVGGNGSIGRAKGGKADRNSGGFGRALKGLAGRKTKGKGFRGEESMLSAWTHDGE